MGSKGKRIKSHQIFSVSYHLEWRELRHFCSFVYILIKVKRKANNGEDVVLMMCDSPPGDIHGRK